MQPYWALAVEESGASMIYRSWAFVGNLLVFLSPETPGLPFAPQGHRVPGSISIHCLGAQGALSIRILSFGFRKICYFLDIFFFLMFCLFLFLELLLVGDWTSWAQPQFLSFLSYFLFLCLLHWGKFLQLPLSTLKCLGLLSCFYSQEPTLSMNFVILIPSLQHPVTLSWLQYLLSQARLIMICCYCCYSWSFPFPMFTPFLPSSLVSLCFSLSLSY